MLIAKELRKKDYIVFFFIAFLGLIVNLTGDTGSSLIWAIAKISIASLLIGIVFGTLTNLIFRKKKSNS